MLKTAIAGLDQELLLARTRAELARLNPEGDPKAGDAGPDTNPETGDAGPNPATDRATDPAHARPVSLTDLLARHGWDFLDHGWTALTGTRPDPARLAPYLEGMTSGDLNKLEVLAAISQTPEGRARAVPLPGLGLRLVPFRLARLPLIGAALRWCAALYRLPEHWRRVNVLWARQEGTDPTFGQTLGQTLDSALPTPAAPQHPSPPRNPPPADPPGLDELYLAFENVFRGTREDIKHRLSGYLPYVRRINAGTADAPILDIGCGRGEWLELLRDQGLHAAGLDLNQAAVDLCVKLGLPAACGDALAHLQALPAHSLGAITAFHLIEHLPLNTQVALLDAAHRALVPGGILILETPNPENLLVGACSFYRDPSHLRPVHPETAFFLLTQRNFRWVYWTGLNPFHHPDMDQVPAGFLRNLLAAPQDYMIIGYKLDPDRFPVHGAVDPPPGHPRTSPRA